MAASFVAWQLPAPAALAICAAHWAGSSVLQQALLHGDAAGQQLQRVQLLRLLVQLIAPVAALYWLEKRSRKAFLADQAREAAGGRGHQQQQQLEGPGSPACGTEHPEKGA